MTKFEQKTELLFRQYGKEAIAAVADFSYERPVSLLFFATPNQRKP
jgi:hypothetical protein